MLKYLSFFVFILAVDKIYAQEVGEEGYQSSVEIIRDIRKNIDYIKVSISDITRRIDGMGEKIRSFQDDMTRVNYEIGDLRKVIEEFRLRMDSIESKLSSIDKVHFDERLDQIELRTRYLMTGLGVAYVGLIASFIILLILIFLTRWRRRGRGMLIFRR